MSVFSQLVVKIVISIMIVIASMLLLQGLLNNLKLRALAVEATSSRLQIIASNIEDTIVRAEGAGLALEEVNGLSTLISRERSVRPRIQQILIVNPKGNTIVATGPSEIKPDDKEAVLRRVLFRGEKVSFVDLGELLYTGRVVFDSSSGVMGAVIIAYPTSEFVSQTKTAFVLMTKGYIGIFVLITVLLVPIVIMQFSGVRSNLNSLNKLMAFNNIGKNGGDSLSGERDFLVGQKSININGIEDLVQAGQTEAEIASAKLEQIISDLIEKKSKQ